MLILAPNQIGKGWEEVPTGTDIKTLDQWLSVNTNEWKLSSTFTSDKVKKPHAVVYRRPMTFKTKFIASLGMPSKIFRMKIKPFLKKWFPEY